MNAQGYSAAAMPKAEQGWHQVWGTPEPSNGSEPESGDNSNSSGQFRASYVQQILEDVDLRSYSNSSDDTQPKERKAQIVEGGPSASSGGRVPGEDAPGAHSLDAMTDWAPLHAIGQCKPCRFINTKSGCSGLKGCSFCHFAHQKTSRPWKSQRDHYKRLAQEQLNASKQKPDELAQVAESLSKKGSYMRSVVQGKIRDFADDELDEEGGYEESFNKMSL